MFQALKEVDNRFEHGNYNLTTSVRPGEAGAMAAPNMRANQAAGRIRI